MNVRYRYARFSMLLLAAGVTVAAEPSVVPPTAAAADAAPGPWTWKGDLGAFFQNTAAGNAENSRDTVINGTGSSLNYLLKGEGELLWKRDIHELKQAALAAYGRTRDSDGSWTENRDEVWYEITLYQMWTPIHFTYESGKVESMFSGPDETRTLIDPDLLPLYGQLLGPSWSSAWENTYIEDGDPFNTGLVKASAGYGQRHTDLLLPEKDKLEAKVGVRVQKRWGPQFTPEEKESKVGLEWSLLYENQLRKEIFWSFLYEGFAPFDDLGNISNLFQAKLKIDVTTYVAVELTARAYYETTPDGVKNQTEDGYDEWSWRQESLIGLTYKF
jgi:hypothetical protein